MFFGRRVTIFCAALVVGTMTWGIVGGVSAAPLLSAAGSPSSTIALSDTTTTTVKSDTTTTTTIKDRDLCPNIEGVQTSIPAGYFVNAAGNCVRIVDLCPNIAGVQTSIPAGMFVDNSGNCVPRVVDLCPNIIGVQLAIPAGLFVNPAGNCVPIIDLCSNIPGIQATVPSGWFRTSNGKCFRRVVDVIGIGPDPAVFSPCVIGDTGPGGGIVFYDAGSPQSWGRCLEAAPKTWKGGTADPFTMWGCPGVNVPGALGTTIGTGQANTTAIVNACTTTGIAARLADNLVFGGESDWFLPSIGELTEMYAKRAIIGGGGLVHRYWSSTQYGANLAICQELYGPGLVYVCPKGDPNSHVRPIRAFG